MESSSRVSRFRRLRIALLLLAAHAVAVSAAPVITQAGFRRPARGAVGEVLILMAQPISSSVQVYFSDGTAPTVPATPLWVDPGRGILAVRVPGAARGGSMKITVDGVDSPLFLFRVDTTPFTPGADALSGQVTSGGAPVVNAAVIVLRDTGCDGEMEVWDIAATDTAGNYLVHGRDGSYMVLFWAPLSARLAGGGAFVTLSATSTVQNAAMAPGTTVTGSVVDAGASGPAIPGARLAFDGQGHEEVLADASGQFTVHLAPGEWDLEVTPPPGDGHAFLREALAVESSSPQSVSPFKLKSGVRIAGTVSRASNGKPLPGAEMYAAVSGQWWTEVDRKTSGGDGTYALIVPPGQTYDVSLRFDRESSYTDGGQQVAVADADASLNFPTPDCATVTGMVRDAVTASSLAGVQIDASQNQQSRAYAQTCADGSYRLRVAPDPAGYTVGVWPSNDAGYAGQAWNNTAAGTPFRCEGSPIALSGAGAAATNVNFSLERGAAISGHVYTQASGCRDTLPNTWVSIDDGAQHQCSLGISDNGPGAPGGYRYYGLPPSSMVAGLRACVYPPSVASQCYSLRQPPGFTPIVAPAGGLVSGIDFCVGATPTTEVTGLIVERSGGGIVLTWSPTSDLYHSRYTVRGGVTARPSTPPGHFPADPPMLMLGQTTECSFWLPANAPNVFFLVTDTGPTSNEGPSGSYGP